MAEKTKPTPQAKIPKQSYAKDLVLLFAVPASIAVIAALAVYVPKWLSDPKYNFMYTVCSDYDCGTYSVDSSGHITNSNDAVTDRYAQGSSLGVSAPPLPMLRYYDVQTDSSKAVTLEEARNYTLDTSSRSPDGYVLSNESSGGGFLFWDSYDQGWYLKDGAKKQKISIDSAGRYGYDSSQITFVGWVRP